MYNTNDNLIRLLYVILLYIQYTQFINSIRTVTGLLYIAKLYEDYYFNGNRKASNIILDDTHNKVIVKDEIEYALTPDVYLALYDELVEYRKTLWNLI